MPGTKLTSPCLVCRAKVVPDVVATARAEPTATGAGAHDGPGGRLLTVLVGVVGVGVGPPVHADTPSASTAPIAIRLAPRRRVRSMCFGLLRSQGYCRGLLRLGVTSEVRAF